MVSEVGKDKDVLMPRRSFLMSVCLGASMLSFGGFSAYGVGKFLFPPGALSGEGESETVRIPFSEIPVGTAKIIRYKGDPSIIVRVSDRSVRALSAACTHLGCIVKWDSAKEALICPCHAAFFDLNGNVIGGPAPSPLQSLPVKIVQDEVIIGEA